MVEEELKEFIDEIVEDRNKKLEKLDEILEGIKEDVPSIPVVDIHKLTGLSYSLIIKKAKEKGLVVKEKSLYRLRKVYVIEKKEPTNNTSGNTRSSTNTNYS